MTTTTMHYRPFHAIPITSIRSFFQAINWIWWLQRAPMFLLAVPASWGVGAFTHERYPIAVAIIAGAGFEAAYLGAIAFADQQLKQDNYSKALWWVLNLAAVACSALINILFSAGGRFQTIVAEDYVHGAPLAVINFLYALLLHRNATRAVAEDMQRAEDERFRCEKCGRGFGNRNRLNGHKRHCKGAA